MTTRSLSLLSAVLTLLVFASSAGAGARTAVTITASTAPWTVVGSTVGIKGGVSPHVAGLSVALQQRSGGEWTTLMATKVTSGGGFSFKLQPKNPGTDTLRVVTSKGAVAAGTSSTMRLRVLHWSYLSDQYIQAPSGGELYTDPIVVHKQTFDHPVSLDAGCYNPWNGDAWINYPLKGQYETFTATVGIADDADPNTVASFKVYGDGQILASSDLVYGQTVKVNVSLAGLKRLQLRMNVPDPTGAAGCSVFFPKVVYGDAQWLGP
jgi:NPCBM/NEW2 domain